jgi:tetratricopeptide (TPR) repeat protein
MRRVIVYLLVFGIGGLFWAGAASYRGSRGRIPASAAVNTAADAGVSRPAFDPALVDGTVRFYEEREQQDPQGAIGIAKLAAAYHTRFREQGDADDLIRAENAARRSLKIRSRNNGAAWHTLAAALMSQHRFAEALVAANHLAAQTPGSPQADYLRAECHLETGRYAEAETNLRRAAVLLRANRVPEDPFGKALRARLREINGKSDDALALYRKARTAAEKEWETPRPTLAWFSVREANCLAMMGRAEDAEAAYRAALASWGRDTRAMSGLAHLRANQGDWAGAIEWAEKADRLTPTQENAMLLYDAYRATGDNEAADRELRLVKTDGSALHAHNRAQALFDADHGTDLDEAEKLARQELTARKDIYSYDALAWVCFKRGKVDEAAALMNRALARGTQDAMLFYHAGRIALARERRPEARTYLEKALAVNPRFHPTAPAEARALLATLKGVSPK